jgi:hypothetical protein
MATPGNTLITRADVTSIIDATTGRKALVLDGVTLELGDTGIRDLSGMFTAGQVSAGRVLVQRTGNVVTWQFINVTLPSNAVHPWAIISNATALAGVLPEVGTFTTPAITVTGASVRLVVESNGVVSIYYGKPATAYLGVLTYVTTKAWPTTLPGVANGQPIGV